MGFYGGFKELKQPKRLKKEVEPKCSRFIENKRKRKHELGIPETNEKKTVNKIKDTSRRESQRGGGRVEVCEY